MCADQMNIQQIEKTPELLRRERVKNRNLTNNQARSQIMRTWLFQDRDLNSRHVHKNNMEGQTNTENKA